MSLEDLIVLAKTFYVIYLFNQILKLLYYFKNILINFNQFNYSSFQYGVDDKIVIIFSSFINV